jgi:hypothetical protein
MKWFDIQSDYVTEGIKKTIFQVSKLFHIIRAVLEQCRLILEQISSSKEFAEGDMMGRLVPWSVGRFVLHVHEGIGTDSDVTHFLLTVPLPV